MSVMLVDERVWQKLKINCCKEAEHLINVQNEGWVDMTNVCVCVCKELVAFGYFKPVTSIR